MASGKGNPIGQVTTDGRARRLSGLRDFRLTRLGFVLNPCCLARLWTPHNRQLPLLVYNTPSTSSLVTKYLSQLLPSRLARTSLIRCRENRPCVHIVGRRAHIFWTRSEEFLSPGYSMLLLSSKTQACHESPQVTMTGSRDLPPLIVPFFSGIFIKNQFRTKVRSPPKGTSLSGQVAIVTGSNTGSLSVDHTNRSRWYTLSTWTRK